MWRFGFVIIIYMFARALRNETCFWFIFRYYINASARTRTHLHRRRRRCVCVRNVRKHVRGVFIGVVVGVEGVHVVTVVFRRCRRHPVSHSEISPSQPLD